MKTKISMLGRLFNEVICAGVILLLAASTSAQNLYVASGNNIIQITPGGVQSTNVSGLNSPTGLAFDSAGDLFVLEYQPENGAIIKITPSGGQSPFTSGLYYPSALAFNSASNLFVAGLDGALQGYIFEFKPGGGESTVASGFSGSGGLAFDRAGDLFESISGGGDIYEFTNNNGTLSTSPGIFASGLITPGGLAFDTNGNLFVSCTFGGDIIKITPGGVQSTFAPVGTAGPSGPGALTFDSGDNLYVGCNGSIIKITPGGTQSTFASGLSGGMAFGPPPPAPFAEVITNIVLPGGAGHPRVNPGLNKIYLNANNETLVVDGNTFSQTTVGSCWDVDVDVTNNNYWTVGLGSSYALVWSSNNSAINAIPLADCTIGISMDAPHRVVWVSAQCGSGNDPVWAIEADTDSVLAGPIGTGASGIGPIVVNSATSRLYINGGNAGSKRVNPAAGYALTSNAFGIVMGVNASANLLYAWVDNNNTLQIINGAPNPEVVLANVTLPFSGGNYIGVNPALNRIYIGNGSSNLVAVLNATTGQSITNIFLGTNITGVGGIGVDASRNRAYVDANVGSTNYLCVIQDLAPPSTPPIITTPPQSVVVTNGAPAAFSVSVTGALPFGYQWQFNGTNLADGGSISGSATSNLVLSAATTNNAGSYTIIITNVYGSVTSSAAILTVVLPSPQNLFVAIFNGGNGAITEITLGGVPSPFASGLSMPTGLAFNNAGDLFVANGISKVIEITPGGTQSIFASGLNGPTGLAFDNTGDLFVANYGSAPGGGSITEITPGGTQSTFFSGLSYPFGLAFSSAGNLFVSEHGNPSDIKEITPGKAQSTLVSGLNYPDGLAFDGKGDLLEADEGSGNVYEFTNNSGTLNSSPGVFVSGLDEPGALAFDSTGDLFVASSVSDIIKITPGGAQSTFASGLNSPTGLAFQPAQPDTIHPNLQAKILSSGNFTFNWNLLNAYPAVGYQVQFTTNIMTGVWINVGNVVTNGAGATNSINAGPKGFYRIMLVQ